jgi:hypothetical protein
MNSLTINNSLNQKKTESSINKIKQLNENLYYILQSMKKEISNLKSETMLSSNNSLEKNNLSNNEFNSSSSNQKNEENEINNNNREIINFDTLISKLKLTEIEENIIKQLEEKKLEEEEQNLNFLLQNLFPENTNKSILNNESFNYIDEEFIENLKEKMNKFDNEKLKIESFDIYYIYDYLNQNEFNQNKMFNFQSFVSFENLSIEEQILLFSFIENKKSFRIIQNEKVSIKVPKKEIKYIPLNKILGNLINVNKEVEKLKKENENLKNDIEKIKKENEIKEENYKLLLMKNNEKDLEKKLIVENQKNENLIKENSKLKDELMKMYIIKKNYDNMFQVKLKKINELNTNFKNEFNKNN